MDEDKKMRGFPRDKEETLSSPEGQNTPDYAANNGAKQGEMPDGQNAEKQADAAKKGGAAQSDTGNSPADDGFFETGGVESASNHSGEEREGAGAERGKKRHFVLWQKPLPQKDRRKYSRSFQIALAGISCGAAFAALLLGYYVYWILATAYIVAQVALMVPLSKQFYVMDVLAYVATVILALLVGGLVGRWWEFIPFVMFFGLHPLANSLQLKYSVNRWVALVVKMVWFDAMLFVMYYALGSFMGLNASTFWQTINDYVWIIILVAGSLFLWLYDYLMFKVQIWINMLVYRIKK